MAKGNRGGKRANSTNGDGGTKYLSADRALYENSDEVLYVEKIVTKGFGVGEDVLNAKSDGYGNLTLAYATPAEYYQQNSKTSYGLYELKSGITNASDLHGSRYFSDDTRPSSKVKSENDVNGVRSVGIDWDKVNSVSGQTFNVKDLLKSKGFKWNGKAKNWVKS